jgi:hypothetical protein
MAKIGTMLSNLDSKGGKNGQLFIYGSLDRGERIVEILHWLGMSRAGLWYLWQRYLEHGVEAIFDAERSGRPAIFSPAGTGSD